MASGDAVNLNVGGQVFQTTRSTLTKYDGYFRGMFESEVTPTLDESGFIFIDRSPKNFDLILNFLRDGNTPIPNCEFQKSQLLKEAEYYTLDGLIYLCGGDPSEEWEKEHLNIKFMRDWRGAKRRGEIQFTSDSEEVEDFWSYGKNKFAIKICYDTENWGEIKENVDVRNFVEMYSGTWNILFYCSDKWIPDYYINRPNQSHIYHRRVERIFQANEFLEEVKKTVVETNIDALVKLNIGGTIFQTSLSTLTKFGGFFDTQLITRIPKTNGEIPTLWVDRRPEYFEVLLNFVRDPDFNLIGSPNEIDEILRHSKFYGLKKLEKMCVEKLKQVANVVRASNNVEIVNATRRSEKRFFIIAVRSSSKSLPSSQLNLILNKYGYHAELIYRELENATVRNPNSVTIYDKESRRHIQCTLNNLDATFNEHFPDVLEN